MEVLMHIFTEAPTPIIFCSFLQSGNLSGKVMIFRISNQISVRRAECAVFEVYGKDKTIFVISKGKFTSISRYFDSM